MIELLSESDAKILLDKLNKVDCEIISVYGFSGHHWAWIKKPKTEIKKEEVLNGSKKRRKIS